MRIEDLDTGSFELLPLAGGQNRRDARINDGGVKVLMSEGVSNSAPQITSPSAFTPLENSLIVGTITATDADGDALTYTIFGSFEAVNYSLGAYYDATKFYLNPTTGVLTFNQAPNFEAPADYGSNGVYDLLIRATDALGNVSAIQVVTITIGNVNEGTLISSNGGGATAALTASENQFYATTVIARDFVGASVTYAIAGGYDAAKFAIDATTGVLSFLVAPNFEAPHDFSLNRVFDVTVSASDGLVTDTQALAISITNVNEAPVMWSNGGGDTAAISVNENAVSSITTVFANDPERTVLTYSLAGGADAARFSINASTGALAFLSQPNFEAPTDVGLDNVYDVVVQVSDGSLVDTQAIAITILNVNEAPVLTSPSAFSVAENGTTVGTITATDQENQARTYSISGGSDAARFAIDAVTGVLRFVAAPNYEAPNDSGTNNIYNLTVAASDGTNTRTQTVGVTVTNVNEAPVITSNGGGMAASVTVNEGATAITAVTSTDPENTARSYSIAGGDDAALFAINASTGALSLVGGRNFEAPSDSNGDNVYDVIVRASDGVNSDTQAIAVTIANIDEPIVITSPATATASENQGIAAIVTAVDGDGTAPVYTIVGGADASLLAVDAGTGQISFISSPDFEAPADADGNNLYEVTISASDAVGSVTQNLAISVINAQEPLAFTSAATFGATETLPFGAMVSAVDPDGGTVTYAIAGGADAHLMSIDAQTGALAFLVAPDFEAPSDADSDNIYEVIVEASSPSSVASQALTITVGNGDEAVSITSSSLATASENGLNAAVVTAVDPDGDAIVYSIVGGADAALFTINADSGVLDFSSTPDFEVPDDVGGDNVYEVVVVASDGAFSDTRALSIAVTNVNEAPDIVSQSAFSVAENQTSIGNIEASDVDSGSLSYAIVGGADAAHFTIDAATGALAFITAPDFEAPADTGSDNVYDVIVAASDGTLTATQSLTASVLNSNEGPRLTSNGGGATANVTLSENMTAVSTVTAIDPEGDLLSYAISGGADAARFTIDANSGVLRFLSGPNFEAPADAGANNVYDVVVTVSDGAGAASQALAVSIANVVDGVSITGSNAANTLTGSVAEDTINGLGGNDTITGGRGADRMTGGSGADRFIYAAVNESLVDARDVITDFSRSQGDKISLTAIDANSNASGNQAFSFIGSGAFTNVASQLRYQQSNNSTIVSGDINGDGLADFAIELSGTINLTASDFLL